MSNSNRSRREFTTEQEVALLQRHFVDKEPASKNAPQRTGELVSRVLVHIAGLVEPALPGERQIEVILQAAAQVGELDGPDRAGDAAVLRGVEHLLAGVEQDTVAVDEALIGDLDHLKAAPRVRVRPEDAGAALPHCALPVEPSASNSMCVGPTRSNWTDPFPRSVRWELAARNQR
jgi:hypothetical protein